MILPGSYALSFAILLIGMLCWSAWASTFKLTGPKWRFELYYIDFAIGVLLAALIAGLTFGSPGWDGFSLMDDLRLAGKRQELFAFLAGCIFNLGNILLVAAISLTGLTISFPVGMGIALATAALVGLAQGGGSNILMSLTGVALVLAAVVFSVMSWRSLHAAMLSVPAAPGKQKTPKRQSRFKGIIVAAVGGVVLGLFYPLVGMARTGENGIGPYSTGLVFAVGVFISTLVLDLFLMNLPIRGKPVEMGDYLRGAARQHWFGVLGGILWMTGTIAAYVASRADGPAHVADPTIWAASQVPVILTTLLGIVMWKELEHGGGKAKALTGASLFLFAGGIATIFFSSTHPSR